LLPSRWLEKRKGRAGSAQSDIQRLLQTHKYSRIIDASSSIVFSRDTATTLIEHSKKKKKIQNNVSFRWYHRDLENKPAAVPDQSSRLQQISDGAVSLSSAVLPSGYEAAAAYRDDLNYYYDHDPYFYTSAEWLIAIAARLGSYETMIFVATLLPQRSTTGRAQLPRGEADRQDGCRPAMPTLTRNQDANYCYDGSYVYRETTTITFAKAFPSRVRHGYGSIHEYGSYS